MSNKQLFLIMRNMLIAGVIWAAMCGAVSFVVTKYVSETYPIATTITSACSFFGGIIIGAAVYIFSFDKIC